VIAPSFSLKDGTEMCLRVCFVKPVVIILSKDDTAGCTAQALVVS
jgi:peroxiredoxin